MGATARGHAIRRSVAPSGKKKMAPVTFQLPYKLRPSMGNSSKIEKSKCGLPGSRGWDWLAMAGEARARRPHQMTFNQLAMASINAFRRGRSGARASAVAVVAASVERRIRGPARSGCRCVAARARSGMRSGVRGAERLAGCGRVRDAIAIDRVGPSVPWRIYER